MLGSWKEHSTPKEQIKNTIQDYSRGRTLKPATLPQKTARKWLL